MEPPLLSLPAPNPRRKFYAETTADDIVQKLLMARNVSRQNNEDNSDAACLQFDTKAVPQKFLPQQLLLLEEHIFLGKNQKLAPK